MRKASSFYNKWPGLKFVFGIRGRLALLALILVAPPMFERVRGLETTRANRIAEASHDLMDIAREGTNSQRTMLRSVEALLKATAHMHAMSLSAGQSCAAMDFGFRLDPAMIASVSIANSRGQIVCASASGATGIDVSDAPYFQKALDTGRLVTSDYVVARTAAAPSIIAAFPVASVNPEIRHVILASVGMNWFDQLGASLRHPNGPSLTLLDANGTALGRYPRSDHNDAKTELLLAQKAAGSEKGFIPSAALDGATRKLHAYAAIPGTNVHLVVGVNEDEIIGPINREIRVAYLQFALISLFVLFGAWLVSERLVIRPIRMLADVAQRFGRGNLAIRAADRRLPVEFEPLAHSFDLMATQLGKREGDLRATNNRLTVLATLDPVSGLANRRGSESRIDFEWMRATETGRPLAALMIDVDFFKQYNDTYGHPEGDTCLGRLGRALEEFANTSTGFAARYGGEEFLLLLPDADFTQALAAAERLREEIVRLAIPHRATQTGYVTVSIGVSSLVPEIGLEPAHLIEAADTGLYAAKNRGRNQVVGHGLLVPVAPSQPMDPAAETAAIDGAR
jgi:diguanylate cyclase (GGDEF)-like protein